jgi:hypothetical protein
VATRPCFAKLTGYGNTDLAHLLADTRRSLAAKVKSGQPLRPHPFKPLEGYTDQRIERDTAAPGRCRPMAENTDQVGHAGSTPPMGRTSLVDNITRYATKPERTALTKRIERG